MSRPGYVDRRGSNLTRKRRRAWLLLTFDVDLGPDRARCHLKLSVDCEREVDEATLSVDRKIMGGSYARDNIQPACKPCQDRQGGLANVATMSDLLDEYRCARDQWEIEFDLKCSRTYYPGIIRDFAPDRVGRNEVSDYVEAHPPPRFKDWLTMWHAARRQPSEDAAGAAASS